MGISASSILVAHFSTGSFLSLSDLHDNPGAKRERKRVGRGIGSGSGKTSGRGMNGQKKRSSVNIPQGFEGGQTPMHRRLPKTGFKNIWAEPLTPLFVGTVQNWIDMGRLVVPADRLMTMKDLVDAGIFKANRVKHGIKLLARGGEHVHTPFHIEVSRASLGAIDAVEKAGGTVTCVHFNRLALRALLKPEAFRVPVLGEDGQVEETLQLPRRARPPPRLMPLYLDSDRRGYLSPEVQRRNKGLFNGQVTSEEIPKLALD
ncbi:hypothetical protein NSK_002957 [Nannochloropsis salina CCMP1776]|uniref:Large ribosomal subunit protein uL15/eL18 domain-containing protein n=1 Tax=Nannochloropsis salina CCMP1776 TaxID=1027361 RepID=A0A4D9D510_9STRA|nr:hypothetical protein NSK_002957 [Nannochloropsis salina CCMP1776]|eukprot:TFJ85447.1 hypothetical protein NSK_002957 [Nannochloropsis salina CCMP1776]